MSTSAPVPLASLATPTELPLTPSGFHVPPCDDVAVARLAAALDLPYALARVLWLRGIRDGEHGLRFLRPNASDLHNPASMLGMSEALARLQAALLRREPILIYGDYDVDGTVATVLLKTALERAARALGVAADVRYHIPHRLREGYGMRETRLADAAIEGVRLVVSVDTGIRAFAAAAEAARLGLDLIVTDHHLPDLGSGLPQALAVLNPNQHGCSYPYKELCGAGVAFKLAQALIEAAVPDAAARDRWQAKTLPSFLKLLALATIADSVPLVGENRIIAALGLKALQEPAQSGLRRLMELAGIDLAIPLTAADVGFRLGPRINAAGRMDIASEVVELFLTQDSLRARELAEKLHHLNEERRATEAQALQEIDDHLATLVADGSSFAGCVVLDDSLGSGSGWHRGVIGILASRVVERTGRPALVLTHENGEAHGSGRSIAGFHLLDALTAAHTMSDHAPLFLRFGGHAHAAGFAVRSADVAVLRERMERLAAALPGTVQDLATPCEAELELGEVTQDFLRAYGSLAPFGQGHAEPVFLFRNLRLCAPVRFIKDRHVALQMVSTHGGRSWRATAWSRRIAWAQRAQTEQWTTGDHFDIAARLTLNRHPDFGGWELSIEALSRSQPPVQQPAQRI